MKKVKNQNSQTEKKKKMTASQILLSIYLLMAASIPLIFIFFIAPIIDNTIIKTVGYALTIVLFVINIILVYFSKTKKWANILFIIFGAIGVFTPIGLLAVIGGILGLKDLDKAENKTLDTTSEKEPIEEEETNKNSNNKYLTFGDYLQDHPIDYQTKPTIAPAFDPENEDNLNLTTESGENIEVEQMYLSLIDDEIYLLGQTVNLSEAEGGGNVVLRLDYENDCFYCNENDDIYNQMINQYKNSHSENNTETESTEPQTKNGNKLELDLYDTSIDEKTWKSFKKTATQEELAIIAIGAKYRLSNLKRRILNSIYFVAMILCFALIPVTVFQSLIAYPFIAFLATKSIRYTDTYTQSYNKIKKENRYLVDDYFNENVFLIIFDLIIYIGMFFITIPYQALMIGIGMIAPNFAISKNGILVSIPKGFDVGNLGAIGEYYSKFNMLDDMMETHESKKKYYTYTNDMGCEQTIYTTNGKDFYTTNGTYVGNSDNKKDLKIKK